MRVLIRNGQESAETLSEPFPPLSPLPPYPSASSVHHGFQTMAQEYQPSSGKKKSTNPNFGSGYLLVGWGLPHERVGSQKFGIPLEIQENQTFCWREIARNRCLFSILVPYKQRFKKGFKRGQQEVTVRKSLESGDFEM